MEIDELAVKITGDSTSLQSAMKAATDAVGKLGIGTSALTGLLGAAGLAGAFKIAYDAADKMVQAYRSDETALLKYNAALAASTVITAQGKRALDEYVPVFAKLSGIAEADTQAQIARLAAYGRTDAQIKTMMETALGMATVLDMDVNNALTQINMTFSGTIGRLGQQIPALKSLTAEQLSNGEGVKLLNSKYGEFAGTLKNSTDVSIKNFENAWSDLMSTMGQSIAGTIQPLRDALTDLFRLVIDSISETNKLNDAHKRMADGTATLNDKLTVQVGILNNLKYARDSAAYDPTVSKEELADLDKAIAAQQKVVDELKNKSTAQDNAAEAAKKAAAATSAAEAEAKKAVEDAIAAQIKGRKEAQKAYEDSLSQIETKVKLGVMTEQEAADAKYLANKKLIDDLVALGYTGARETGQIGDKALADAVARNDALYKNTSDMIDKIVRAYETAAETLAAHRKTVLEGFRETREAEKAEAEAIEASKRAAETVAVVRAVITKRFIAGKQEEQAAIRDAEQAELDAINATVETRDAAAKVVADLAAKNAAAKRAQWREDKEADKTELDAIDTARRADETTTILRQQLARNFRKEKLEIIKEIRDADISASAAIAEADVMAAEVKSTTDTLLKQARLDKLQGFRDDRAAEQITLDLAKEASAEAIRIAQTVATQKLVLLKKHINAKQEEAAELRRIESAEYEAIQDNIRDAATTATVLQVLSKRHIADKRAEAREIKEADRVEYEIIQATAKATEEVEKQKAALFTAHRKEKIEGIRENNKAEQAEAEILADYEEIMLYKRQNAWADYEAYLEEMRKKEAEAEKEKLLAQVKVFAKYASTVSRLSSQLFSGIGFLISAQAENAVDAVERRLERLKKSYGDTASELQTMYDALERMGAKEKAASIKAQLDKQKAIEDYTSLSMEQLANLYATAIELGDDQAAAEITAAMARVKAEKDAAEEIKQIKYDAAVAEWNMKLMSTTASAAQAVMDTYKAMISLGPLGITIAPIAAAASAAFGITQIAAVAEAKPKLDTGGVIRAREETPFAVGKGTGEIMFGTSSLGDPLMQGFADLVASKVSRSPGAARLLPVQIVLDGRVLAESTVKLIDDGQVRFRKPLKVAQR